METMTIGRFLAMLGRNSVEAGVLVLVVLLAQWVLGKRLGPRWRSALWLLVMLRLLLPVSIHSVFSVFNLLPKNTARLVAFSAPNQAPNQAAVEQPSPAAPATPARSLVLRPALPTTPDVKNPGEENITATESPTRPVAGASVPGRATVLPRISWAWLVFLGWLGGVALLSVYVATGSFRAHRRFSRLAPMKDPQMLSLLTDCQKQLQVYGHLLLAESPDVVTPALHGFLRPCLLLPTGFGDRFSVQELRFILLHELAHVKRRDILLNWLAAILQVVHWFNPLIWFGFARWRADRELACDALALEAAGENQNRAYGQTILRLLENFTPRAAVPGLVGILEDKRQLRRRIKMIAGYRAGRKLGVAAAGLLAVLGIVCLTDAQNHSAGTNQLKNKPVVEAAEAGTLFQMGAPAPRPVVSNGSTMKVLVLDAKTGQPLASAEVLAPNEAAFFNGSENAPHWFTDTNGVAVIHLGEVPTDHLAQQSWFTMSVRHEGYAPHGFSWSAENKDVRPSMPKDLTVRLEHGVTAGGFARDERGAPLEGIRVRIFGANYWQGLRQEYAEFWSDSPGTPPILTDAAGHWQVSDFPGNLDVVRISLIRPDGSVQRFVEQGESDPRETGEPVDLKDLKADKAVFVLQSGIDVHGVVMDPEGNPVPGALIEAGYGIDNIMRAGEVRSDAAGRFELAHRVPGQLILTADANRFALTSMVVDVWSNMPDVRLQMSPVQPVQIRVLGGDDRPIAGAKVIVYPLHVEGQMLKFDGVTDAKGTLVWSNAPVSDFALMASSPDGKMSQEIRLTPGDRQAIFRLRAGMENEIMVRGQAHDAKTGHPVKLESVSYQTGDQEGFRWNGQILDSGFELAIPQARFRPQGIIPIIQLKLEAKGYRTLFTSWRDFAEGDWHPDFALQPADTASGKVLLPDGSPASGARFWISMEPMDGDVMCSAPNQYWGPHLIEMHADDQGNFTLPQAPEEQPVLFAHPGGYLKVSMAEIGRQHAFHLQPWSSVEGTLKIAGKPEDGVQIGLGNLVFQPTTGFYITYTASTAPDGSFKFSNVPAGNYKLYCELNTRMGRQVVEDHPMPIVVKPGETLKVDYSNNGRAVIGQATPSIQDMAVNWLNDSQTLTLKQNTPPIQQPNIKDYATTKAFYAAMDAYYDSPERLEQAREARTYQLIFQPDGTFRADDIPPGSYQMQITLTKTNKSESYSPYPNPADELGSLKRELVVPPGSTPFDLGTLVVPVKDDGQRLKPVNFTAQTLDGKSLSLAQFKGKYVVLAFWALWSERSTAQLADLNKLQTEFAQDDRIVFVGADLNDDTTALRKAVSARDYSWTQTKLDAAALATTTKSFDVSQLPAIYLINPKGEIVARDLQGDRLRSAVQRVLAAR
jgi:beta-lactamase regulating signal transducer with metallopeptidase domain/cytochrome oxidase Cu insertion factor (SCO1/SenC/PrrC family)